jgi:predicted Zn-dependent protease
VYKRFASGSAASGVAGQTTEEVVNVLLYLANAYFQAGQIVSAKKMLLKAIHLTPEDLILWYNLALAQEVSGRFVPCHLSLACVIRHSLMYL